MDSPSAARNRKVASRKEKSQRGRVGEGEKEREQVGREIVNRDVMERYVDFKRKNLFVSPEHGGQSKFPISSGVGEIGCPGKERATLTANGKCPCQSNQVR